MKTPKDLTGHQSGKLTVTAPAEPDYRGLRTWQCKCECGRTAVVGDAALRSRTTRSCGCLTGRRPIVVSPALAAKFWDVVGEDLDPKTCWPWPMCLDGAGYGCLSHRGRRLAAHRVALAIRLGGVLGDDVEACHSCDHPNCANPLHLSPGTHSENHRQAVERRRHEASKKAKRTKVLTQSQAEMIRFMRAEGATARSLAAKFAVDEGTIHRIVTNKIWRKGESK